MCHGLGTLVGRLGGGYSALALMSTKLKKADVANEVINFYTYAAAISAFLFYITLASKQPLEVPQPLRWWFLPLGLASFVATFALVQAYADAPNPGFVQGIGTLQVVLTTLATAAIMADWSTVNWKTITGMVLIVGGALVLGFGSEAKK